MGGCGLKRGGTAGARLSGTRAQRAGQRSIVSRFVSAWRVRVACGVRVDLLRDDDIDEAEEYFVTNVLTGPTAPEPHCVPIFQFLKNGYLLTQFVGGDGQRLIAELSRLGAALRLKG